jgi:hypothetical protein
MLVQKKTFIRIFDKEGFSCWFYCEKSDILLENTLKVAQN